MFGKPNMLQRRRSGNPYVLETEALHLLPERRTRDAEQPSRRGHPAAGLLHRAQDLASLRSVANLMQRRQPLLGCRLSELLGEEVRRS